MYLAEPYIKVKNKQPKEGKERREKRRGREDVKKRKKNTKWPVVFPKESSIEKGAVPRIENPPPRRKKEKRTTEEEGLPGIEERKAKSSFYTLPLN